MRFFMLVLLVLLLPLRGGLGDAMATTGPHHGTQHEKHQQHDERHAEHQAGAMAAAAHVHGLQDCAGHGAAHSITVESVQASATNDKVATSSATCDACSACQTCHAVGLAFSRSEVQPLPAPNAQPVALSTAFASAPAARDQKPPIS